MIYITFFFTILLLFTALWLVPSKKKQQTDTRLKAYFEEDPHLPQQSFTAKDTRKQQSKKEPFLKRVATPLWGAASKFFKRRMSIVKTEQIELKLLKAGSPFKMSPVDFRIVQLVSLLGLPLFYGVFAFLVGLSGSKALLFIIMGIGFGAIAPHFYINSKIKNRAKGALKELPDFVDLLTVSLEAGLGFDSALTKVIHKQKGVLSDEFRICLDEIRLGKTRREGLSGIKQRLDVEEINTLINSVVRAEKLGVGMVQVLRIQAVDVREKRRQRAEELAMKAPIKMLFPLVLFIFPSLFIIILGPAVIQMINTFKGM